MQQIGDVLQKNIILRGADALSIGGYTQVPNHVLENSVITPGAKLAYAMLLKYAWNNGFCFPGQARLATDMGVARQTANVYVQELARKGLIRIRRQGQGRPNLYELDLTVRGGKVKKKSLGSGRRQPDVGIPDI